MCGIAGAVGKGGKNRAVSLIASLRHRGPDSYPVVVSNNNASIAATRLSIVDVAGGEQPMFDVDSGNIVALNGEVYNHCKLRENLEEKGVRFNTKCDTEVLLWGFTLLGPSFVEKLEGIFAIAFYSSSDGCLYLFRDFFGVKPLYYNLTEKGLDFASEAKSFFIGAGRCDFESDFFIYNKILDCSPPELSIFKGVKSVPIGGYIKYNQRSVTLYKYSPEVKHEVCVTFEEAIAITNREITKSVESQIPIEVDWGVLLSGGIDSSVLAFVCSKLSKNKISTFTIGPKEEDTEDLLCARRIAKYIGSDHTEIRLDSDSIANYYADYVFSIEDLNPKFFFYYFLSKEVGKTVKVALCGEGADELYAGYPIYRQTNDFLMAAELKLDNLKFLLSPDMREEIKSIITGIKRNGFNGIYDFMIKKQLPYYQLNVVDKCSMKFGVEYRVPYLGISHALNVMNYPKSLLEDRGIEKELLRTAFAESGLPTLNRKKTFAGTRTLPHFYKKLYSIAEERYDELKIKYPEMKFLDPVEMYSLDLFYEKMITSKKVLVNDIKFININ